MHSLDSRKERILQAVINEYINAAEPIGSELLACKYELGVRSATIRNELAEMEEMGFLEQPHTSAGRIPSDQGYRYFVNNLASPSKPNTSVRSQFKQISDDGEFLEDILRETTQLLSRMTQLMCVATIHRDSKIVIKNILLNAIDPYRAIFVLMLSNGQIETRIIESPFQLSETELNPIEKLLNLHIQGKSLHSLANNKLIFPASEEQTALESKLHQNICNTIRSLIKDLSQDKMIIQGEEFLFAQPESRKHPQYMDDLLRSLSDPDLIYVAVATEIDQTKTVIIGRENHSSYLYPFSFIKNNFFVGELEAGTIGLMGPTRLNYECCMPLLEFASQSVTFTLTHYISG